MTSSPPGRYTEAMVKLRQQWGNKCSACGRKLLYNRIVDGIRHPNLEFAHVKPTPLSRAGRGRGMPQRYHDIVNHPECYVLLCWWCHAQIDPCVPDPEVQAEVVEYDDEVPF